MGEGGVVARRRVFYIPGYDPSPPRRYRELYRTESEAQAALSGYDIAQGPGPEGPAGWTVRAVIEGERVDAQVEVLAWSDIVRDSMGAGILATYAQLAHTAWVYAASGALWRLVRLRKGPVLAIFYPVAVLLAQLAAALAAARVCGALIGAVLPPPWPWAGLIAAWPVLAAFRRADGRILAWYLMHDFAFGARDAGAYAPELEARLAAFGDRIAAALTSDADEVLVVGHSSGAHLAVSVLADLIRQGRVPADGPALSLLTLGQVVPMVSFLPRAGRLRGDLHFLAARDEIAWVDVSAPGDGASFALCDPVAVSGVAPPDKRWPLVISAAFTRTLLPQTRAALRWRFFRLHFQYLHAFDALTGGEGEYDYFRITAGPQTLARRFARRPPSGSRIEAPLSPHVSMAA